MKSDSAKIRLRDIARTNTHSYSPKEKLNFVNYLDTGNITENRIDSIQSIDLSSEKLPSRAKRKVKYNNIIYSTVRPNQLHYGLIKQVPPNFLVSTGFIVIEINEDKAVPEYIYYFLTQRDITEHLQAIGEQSVSAYPSIKPADIENLELSLPNLETQGKIASLLRILDDKIQLNNEINNNLLEQALTLYENEFSKLDRNGCIGDYCSIKSGFAFKSSWWTDNGIKVIKIGSINQDNLNLLECSYVNEDKIDKAKDFQVVAGDLLIAMTGATIGKFSMVPYSSEILLVNQRVGKFFLGENPVEKLPFIYCTLKQPDVYYEIVNRGQGSAQPNISASDIMSIPCVIPDSLKRDKRKNGTDKKNTLSDSTIRKMHMLLHEIMEAAVKSNLTVKNPTKGTVVPKLDTKPKTIFNEDQLNIFMDAIKEDEKWFSFFYTEITTGLRRGEICGLKWTDLEEENCVLKVQRTVKPGPDGNYTVGDTKTETGKRNIILPASTLHILEERHKTSESEWIFPMFDDAKQPMNPNQAYKRLKKIIKDTGLPDIRFHDLRHTFATHALASGVDPKTLSGILGHTNASFTLDTYTHVTQEMQKNAADIVGGFIGNLVEEVS